MDFCRFGSQADQMRSDFPDRELWQLGGEGSAGRVKVRRHHWDPDVYIEVPLTDGVPGAAGATIHLEYQEGDRQRPFYQGQIAGAGQLKKKKSILVGNGQWLTPEADYSNSYGLTLPFKRLILKLDGSTPGTLSVLQSGINEYAVGVDWGSADPAVNERRRLFHEKMHVRQFGLLAYTEAVPGGSRTILARYTTVWANPIYAEGYIGVIQEYDISGTTTIAEWSFNFSTDEEHPNALNESQASRIGYHAMVDRRQGYFFVDLVSESSAIYIVAVDTGIHTLYKSSGLRYRSDWFPDPLRPQNAGSVTAWGKYVFECGWSGWDKSTAALDDFNALVGALGGMDPATLRLALRDGGLVDLPLPDDTTYRGDFRYYVRQADNTYTTMSVSLRNLLGGGKTTRKVLSCGIYTYYDTPILLADGSPAGILDTGAGWNLQSSRWPLWLDEVKEIWIGLCSMADGATAEDPGQSFFQVVSIDFSAGIASVKSEIASVATVIEPYPGWLADKMAEESALAAASRSTVSDTGSYTTHHVVATDPSGGDLTIPNTTWQHLVGWTYDGIDPAFSVDKWLESDQFIPHPWPCVGGPSAYAALLGLNDAMAITSRATPAGCFDREGNHYTIVSEPVHVYESLVTGLVYDPRPPDWPIETFWPPHPTLTLDHQDTGEIAWFAGLKGLQGWYTDYYQWYVTPHAVVRAYTRHDGTPFHYWLPDPIAYPLEAQPWTDEFDFYYARAEALPTVLEFTCLSGYDRGEIEHLGSVTLPYPGSLTVVDHEYYTNKKVSVPTVDTRHITKIVKTTRAGDLTKVDITQKFSWSGATSYSIPKATDLPFALGCWQWAPVGAFLFVLRQMYQQSGGTAVQAQGISNPATDLLDEYPWFEVYRLSDLTFVGRLPLWPSNVTPFKFLQWDTPPRMDVDVDANGNCSAQVMSVWNEATYDFRDINNNWQLKNEFSVSASGVIAQEGVHLYAGLDEPGIPSATESSTMARNAGRAFWIDQANSVVQYTPP